MKGVSPNHYEQAFENWLVDNKVQYVAIDEHKKRTFGRSKIKSFDFLVYPPDQRVIIAEVKGRLFKGRTLAKLAGLECWVTTDDIDGLAGWQQVFGPDHLAVFVFAYRIQEIDVDLDGRDSYDFAAGSYVFFAVRLDDYCRYMKLRSPKWRTVTLAAHDFRRCVVQMQQLLF